MHLMYVNWKTEFVDSVSNQFISRTLFHLQLGFQLSLGYWMWLIVTTEKKK